MSVVVAVLSSHSQPATNPFHICMYVFLIVKNNQGYMLITEIALCIIKFVGTLFFLKNENFEFELNVNLF